MYSLIELCAGGAALTLHLLGARRALLPYQGGKWRFRHRLSQLIEEAGCRGTPDRVTLYDPSAWGIVSGIVIQSASRHQLIEELEHFAAADPKEVYHRLHDHPVPENPVALAAQFLFLQRLSYSGKAVGIRDGIWKSPGFNSSSAYGIPGTERFGNVSPMIPSLLKTLHSYAVLREPSQFVAHHQRAPSPTGSCSGPTLVYLDPPYHGSTLYPDGHMARPEVIRLAQEWHRAGASVMISEGEAIPELVAEGWSPEALYKGRDDTSPFRGKQPEWVTLSPGFRSTSRPPAQSS